MSFESVAALRRGGILKRRRARLAARERDLAGDGIEDLRRLGRSDRGPAHAAEDREREQQARFDGPRAHLHVAAEAWISRTRPHYSQMRGPLPRIPA